MIDRYEKKPTVYTAYSKHFFFAKMQISAFVLDHEGIPLNPFTNWGYFMDDMVDREKVARGNNNLIYLADEVWTFGPIADGVFREVKLANAQKKKIRYFTVGKKISDIREMTNKELIFEDELLGMYSNEEIYKEFGL